MRPARCVDDSGSADMIVSPVTVTLEDALEVTQESFGPFSFTTHSKVEDYRSGRPAVLPKVCHCACRLISWRLRRFRTLTSPISVMSTVHQKHALPARWVALTDTIFKAVIDSRVTA